MDIEFKTDLLAEFKEKIISDIDSVSESINSTKSSRDSATKSSAGDKHETSRAMMQIELDNSEVQLQKLKVLLNNLNKINPDRKTKTIGLGSWVETNEGNYFFTIGLGKYLYKGEAIFVISPLSPIGILFKDKKEGDVVVFQNRKIEIKKLV